MDQLIVGVYPGGSGRIMVAPLHYAIAHGMFAEHGLEVVVAEPAEHPWFGVAAGELDLGVGFVDYATWPEFGHRLVAVAVQERFDAGHGLTALLARRTLLDAGELTDDPGSIAGRRVGLLGARGDDYLCWRGVVDQAGLRMDDIVPVPVPHVGAQRESALREADVDLVIGRRPRQIAAESAAGLTGIWRQGDQINPDLQARYWLASRVAAEGGDDRIRRFLAVIATAARAVRAAFDDREPSALAEISHETTETADLLSTMRPPGFDPTGVIDVERLTVDLVSMAEAGLVPATTTVADVAVPSLWTAEDASQLEAISR